MRRCVQTFDWSGVQSSTFIQHLPQSCWGHSPSVHSVWTLHLPRGSISAGSQHPASSGNSWSPFPCWPNNRGAKIQCWVTQFDLLLLLCRSTHMQQYVRSHLFVAGSSINFSQDDSCNSSCWMLKCNISWIFFFFSLCVVCCQIKSGDIYSMECARPCKACNRQ